MYPIQTGNPFMVQQIVSGSGGFDGSDYGRATGIVTGSSGNNGLQLSARLYGAHGNDYTLQLVNAGAGVAVAGTTATQSGNNVIVSLRRTTSAITATAVEVAQAINAIHCGLAARHTGTGLGVVAAYPTTALMSGGYEPVLRGQPATQFLWTPAANVSAGLFFFEQEETITIRQFEAKFTISSGTHSVTVSRENLDERLQPIAAESIPVFAWDHLTSTNPDIAFSDVGIIVHQNQALKVVTPSTLAGTVRFDVRKGARYPYL